MRTEENRELELTARQSRLKLNLQQRQRSGGAAHSSGSSSGSAANLKVFLLLLFPFNFNFNLWRAFFGFQRSSRYEFRATKNLPFSLRNPSKKYVNKAKKKQQIRIPAQEQSAPDAAKKEREREGEDTERAAKLVRRRRKLEHFNRLTGEEEERESARERTRMKRREKMLLDSLC